jgi:Na+/melibiose symporter-like transporter
MATHETGEYVVEDLDATSLHTHHEGDEDSDGARGRDRAPAPGSSEEADPPRDEEEAVPGEKKNKYELQDQTNLLPVRQVIVIFMGLNCALFCSLLEQTIVTTALPTLGKVFNQAAISSWVGTAYMLTSTALQPVYGRLSDIFGRKSVLLGSLVIFMLGSLACALSTSMIMLIIFRAIQGIGGGGILTLALIISELTTTACA